MQKAYHREDLRKQLVEAAYGHVGRDGHDDLSIRKLAQLVSVSSAAPYHYFPDRRSVLIAVAERGFQVLRADLERAWTGIDAPVARLVAASNAFFDFVRANMNLFELMYDSELTRPVLDPQIEEQYRQIYVPILAEFSRLAPAPAEAVVRVQLYWSMIFGFAFLSNRGMRGQFVAANEDQNALRERVILAAIG